MRLLELTKPQEVYNLAAQSSVQLTFEQPLQTFKTVGVGVLNLLEAVRLVDRNIKLFQTSSSEIYWKCTSRPQDESTSVYPCSPYASAKLMAQHAVRIYREAYGLHACVGILYTHESSRRGLNFVTQKIVDGVVRIKYGLLDKSNLVILSLSATGDTREISLYARGKFSWTNLKIL